MKNKLEINSDIENINLVEKFVEDIAIELSIKDELYGNVLVSVTEAVNNAIIHGNQLDDNKFISLECDINTNILCFRIKDEGKGFDYEHIPDPTLPENIEKLNGRGVFLIKHLSDELNFDDNGSLLEIKFNLNGR